MQKSIRLSILALPLLAAAHLHAFAQEPVPPKKSAGATNAEAAANAEAIRRRAPSPQQAAEGSAPSKLSPEATAMLQQAVAVSRALVDTGEIGMRRAVDPAVHGLAQSLVARHQMLMQEVQAMARQRQLLLGGNASTSTQLARLSKTGGFDTVFVREVGIGMQTRAIASLGNQAALGDDPALAAWHARYLNTLREGLADAQRIPLRNAPDKTPRSSSGDPSAPAAASSTSSTSPAP